MNKNIVDLDLSRFSQTDVKKIHALQKKVWLMRRWCRCDCVEEAGREIFILYSGDNGPKPYVIYRISKLIDGKYILEGDTEGKAIGLGQTMDAVINLIPDNFYFTEYHTGSS